MALALSGAVRLCQDTDWLMEGGVATIARPDRGWHRWALRRTGDYDEVKFREDFMPSKASPKNGSRSRTEARKKSWGQEIRTP
jgi:hypothetical protein